MKGFNMNKVLGTIKKRNSERRISKCQKAEGWGSRLVVIMYTYIKKARR